MPHRATKFRQAYQTTVRLFAVAWNLDRPLILGMLISTTLPAIIPFINIYIYKLIIDRVIHIIQTSQSDLTPLYLLFALRLFTYYLQEIATASQDYFERLLWLKLPIKLQELILNKFISLDIQYFEDPKFRDLLENTRENSNWRPLNLLDTFMYLIQSVIQTAIAIVALIQLNWLLGLPIILISIPEFLVKNRAAKVGWGIWEDNSPQRKHFWYLINLLQSGNSTKEIRLFNLGQLFVQRTKDIQQQYFQKSQRILRQSQLASLFISFCATGILVGTEIYVISLALFKKLTVGDISFYTGVVTNFQNGLGGLIRNISHLYEHSLYVTPVFELLDTKPKLVQSDHPIILQSSTSPRLEFRHVTFTYPGTDQPAINDLSFILEPGQKIALVGENGAGKTTLIKLLVRFYDPDSGDVLVNGQNLKDLDLPAWYQHIGILFQEFNHYEDTVTNNIQFGDINKHNDTLLHQAAQRAGAESVIAELKNGYNQMLGHTFEHSKELSTGQWQKIALARAFFRNAPLLILDEPTAAIDAKAEAEIFDSLMQLSQDKSVIIISHRFSTVRHADLIFVLNQGQIVESGSHQALMAQNGRYATLFNLQAKAYQ